MPKGRQPGRRPVVIIGADKPAAAGATPAITLTDNFSVEGATLGRQPNKDGGNSGAMWFE
ncbi:hypothetical protein OIU91_00200 [Streptomyces sp. NBC_01456]|uniref:hypothetical protein n=1 Tax=unclassified Streptomyces TaxID=2593676 RepID=UPI002E33C98A|nr:MULTISPECIES: hypothetical protein [unclassified Streptomyces]